MPHKFHLYIILSKTKTLSGSPLTILSRSNLKPINEIAASKCPCQAEEKCPWTIELNKFNPEIDANLELKKKVKELKSHARLDLQEASSLSRNILYKP